MARPRRSEEDGDDGDDRRARERTCVATRLVRPVDRLIRFVVAPDGTLTPDLKRRLPGRGVHVSASRAAFDQAVRKKAFSRGLKEAVTVPPDLGDRVDLLLERQALDMLSLANKAGLVVPGTAKVFRAIESGKVRVLLHAQGASAESEADFARAVRRVGLDHGPAIVRIFTSAQMDLALGRSNVIHAALVAGPACDGFLDRVAALETWRHGGLPEAAMAAVAGRPTGDGAPTDEGDVRPTGAAIDLDKDKPA
ncbi:MAG: RNA-binding protein [Labrys sp. (in: a-proteobacteria)]